MRGGRQNFVGPGLGGGVDGEPRLRRREVIACDGRGQLDILLDYVYAVGCYEFIEQPAAARSRGSASPISRRQPARRPTTADRMAPCRSRTASYWRSECAAQSLDFIEGLGGERRFRHCLVERDEGG